MSRFDILCVVRDEVDSIKDTRLANFVVDSHTRHHPINTVEETKETSIILENGIELIPQDILKKYIVYAKLNIHPKLQQMDQEKISKMYSQLRQESLVSFLTQVLFSDSILLNFFIPVHR